MAAANWAAATASEMFPSATTTTSREHEKFSPDRVSASVAAAPVSIGMVPPVGLMHSAGSERVDGVDEMAGDVLLDDALPGDVSTGVSPTNAEHPVHKTARRTQDMSAFGVFQGRAREITIPGRSACAGLHSNLVEPGSRSIHFPEKAD